MSSVLGDGPSVYLDSFVREQVPKRLREFDFTIVVVPNKGEEERFVHALSSLPVDVRLLRDLEGSIEWCLS